MDIKPVDIEVFTSSICSRCQRAGLMVEELLEEEGFEDITWREVDVVEEIDYAVALAILFTPAIAIGGKRVFSTLPSKQKLRSAIQHHLTSGSSGNE